MNRDDIASFDLVDQSAALNGRRTGSAEHPEHSVDSDLVPGVHSPISFRRAGRSLILAPTVTDRQRPERVTSWVDFGPAAGVATELDQYIGFTNARVSGRRKRKRPAPSFDYNHSHRLLLLLLKVVNTDVIELTTNEGQGLGIEFCFLDYCP
ncbi:hypothetical protein BT96DRAFT_1014082 [Gymnopus androsaceus JB14]|uniref:Uncharacterized protein n=1 Tax=Gymnopus androsaceus JB14 TaxID=1447944 RepID=A0A6A4IA79_9AGAR|nr:hypothetical protein BT96DRAFT_1014082 [Gymnopus androsaceus JB14]